jgi:hypothetical protein
MNSKTLLLIGGAGIIAFLLYKGASAGGGGITGHVYVTFRDTVGVERELDATALLATPDYINAGITTIEEFIALWENGGMTYVSQRIASIASGYPFPLPAERTLFMRGHLSHSGMVDSEQDIYGPRIAGRIVNPQYLPEVWSLT